MGEDAETLRVLCARPEVVERELRKRIVSERVETSVAADDVVLDLLPGGGGGDGALRVAGEEISPAAWAELGAGAVRPLCGGDALLIGGSSLRESRGARLVLGGDLALDVACESGDAAAWHDARIAAGRPLFRAE